MSGTFCPNSLEKKNTELTFLNYDLIISPTSEQSNAVSARKPRHYLNLQLLEPILHWGKILKMESKHQSHSLHFVFYTLSSGSCFCFSQSRQTDPVLPSFPFQNRKAARQSDRLAHVIVLNDVWCITTLHCVIYTSTCLSIILSCVLLSIVNLISHAITNKYPEPVDATLRPLVSVWALTLRAKQKWTNPKRSKGVWKSLVLFLETVTVDGFHLCFRGIWRVFYAHKSQGIVPVKLQHSMHHDLKS